MVASSSGKYSGGLRPLAVNYKNKYISNTFLKGEYYDSCYPNVDVCVLSSRGCYAQ